MAGTKMKRVVVYPTDGSWPEGVPMFFAVNGKGVLVFAGKPTSLPVEIIDSIKNTVEETPVIPGVTRTPTYKPRFVVNEVEDRVPEEEENVKKGKPKFNTKPLPESGEV